MSGWRDDLLLFTINAVYGTAYVAQRAALADLPPALLGFVRLGLASVVLLPFVLPFVRRTPRTRAAPGDGVKIFWMGVLGFGVAYVLSNFGLAHSTATNAALLITLEPISLMVLSPILLGERLRRREAAGAVLVLAGAVLVVLDGVPGVTAPLLSHWRGDLLLVLSAVAFASYSLFARDLLARWDARTLTARSLLWGTVSMVPPVAIEWLGGARPVWTGRGAMITVYLAVVVTALAYLAWNVALARVSAPRAAIFINVQPLVGVGLGIFALGEPATAAILTGAALILLGLAITTISPPSRAP